MLTSKIPDSNGFVIVVVYHELMKLFRVSLVSVTYLDLLVDAHLDEDLSSTEQIIATVSTNILKLFDRERKLLSCKFFLESFVDGFVTLSYKVEECLLVSFIFNDLLTGSLWVHGYSCGGRVRWNLNDLIFRLIRVKSQRFSCLFPGRHLLIGCCFYSVIISWLLHTILSSSTLFIGKF